MEVKRHLRKFALYIGEHLVVDPAAAGHHRYHEEVHH